MKTKNVILPVVAFVVAIGMAFATTPINGFVTEVWRVTPENPCHASDCMIIGTVQCDVNGISYYNEETCTSTAITAFEKKP